MRMPSYLLAGGVWLLGIVGPTLPAAEGSAIAWNSPQTIAGESDVSLQGTLDRAYVFGPSGVTTTVNGVTFVCFDDQTSDTLTAGGRATYSSYYPPYATLSAAYKIIAGKWAYAGNTTTATLTFKNLTPQQTYQVQVWANDSRFSWWRSRTETVSGSLSLRYNTSGYDGGLGQYAVGTFQADSTNQSLVFSANGKWPQINGVQLRLLPPIVLDVKTYGGAVGDGVNDDRIAIQQTIDAVRDYVRSNGNCGGVVTFPAGTYKVSLDPAVVCLGTTVSCLRVYANITLQGPISGMPAQIKLADNSGPYTAMIGDYGGSYGGRGVDNFTMTDLTVDGNSANNLTPCGPGLNMQGAIWMPEGQIIPASNISIRRCVFQNFASINTINFCGWSNYSNVLIDSCAFTGMGRPKNSSFASYDHSTIYTGPNGMTVRNCTFTSEPGTKGVCCAMEMHGYNQLCVSNYVNGYAHAVNLVGDESGYDNQFCISNTFDNVACGVLVWPARDMQNVIIDGNTMNLMPGLWTDPVSQQDMAVQASGISFSTCDPACTGLVSSIWITSNRINYSQTGPRIDFYSAWYNQLSAGIQLFNCVGVNRFDHLFIIGNTIDHPLSNGIWGFAPTTDCWIHQNIIIDPGNSTNLTNYGQSTCAVWWTAALSKDDDIGQYANGLYIPADYADNNVFIDDRPVHRMLAGLWTNAKAGINGAGYAQGQASGLAPGGASFWFWWDGGATVPPGGWELY